MGSTVRKQARKRIAMAAAAVVPAAGWALPAPVVAAEDGAGATDGDARATAPGFTSDVEAYAAEFGVSVAEAEERLTRQGPLTDTLGQLRELAGDRLAGVWIEHQPDYRAVVRLTGPAADRAAFDAVVGGSQVPIDVRTDAPLSLAQLETERARVQDELRTLLPGATTGIHQQSGSVMVYAPATSGARSRTDRTGAVAEVRTRTDAPVRVTNRPGQLRAEHDYGGDRLSNCTSGFSVYDFNTGVRGIITAGHCGSAGGAPGYQGYNGENYALTFQREQQDLTTDIGFYTSAHDTFGEIYADSHTTRMTVTGFTEWANHDVGDWVCHQGKTTGYSCGTISDPRSTSCAFAPVCDATWVIVDGDNLACAGGDSGGPWFTHDGRAWGIHHGGWSRGTAQGECDGAIYTPIDFKINATGTQLLVG